MGTAQIKTDIAAAAKTSTPDHSCHIQDRRSFIIPTIGVLTHHTDALSADDLLTVARQIGVNFGVVAPQQSLAIGMVWYNQFIYLCITQAPY